MAHTVISAKYPPLIDATRTPLAYGVWALPRLNRELNDDKLLVRQRAVMSLCDYLHDPEHIATALREGIVQSLKGLLPESDLTVRQKATECLYVIAGHAIGRDAILEHEVIRPVARLINDEEDIARKNAHLAIEMISETPPGAAGIVEAELVKDLVDKLRTEVDEIKELILNTLHYCMKLDTSQALATPAMETFIFLLDHGAPTIRYKAARDIMDLSVPLAGKNKAVEYEAMAKLINLLNDKSKDVKAGAAGAIMTITITTKGKYAALNGGAMDPLLDLLEDTTSEIRLNALKALTCLSEAPEGRRYLLERLDKIRERITDAIPAVCKAAEICERVITWKP